MRSDAFWKGVLGGVVAAVVVVAFVLPALGLFNMSAVGDPGLLDWWGETNSKSSLNWRAPEATIPAAASVARGIDHFRESCIHCHGAPDVERAEWARHMEPMPPKLWLEETQEMSDGELYRIVSGGVRMTGMPAFGPSHDEAAIWDIVATVRGLTSLSLEQTQRLKNAGGVHHHNGSNNQGDEHRGSQDAVPDQRHDH